MEKRRGGEEECGREDKKVEKRKGGEEEWKGG